ncbi:hypothetical protein C8R47DRAFT_193404 [Mycena vitilis]|nr:hypothetical protein C8R47DRAFT_193404 [Mycena vitilis]
MDTRMDIRHADGICPCLALDHHTRCAIILTFFKPPPSPMASSSQGQSRLASLPPELLDEIISHYSASFSFLSPLARQEHVPQRLARQQALRSLSQSCVHFRRVFLPLAWEHMEFSVRIPSFEERYVGAESELAELFTYTKSVHLSLQHWTDKRILRAVHGKLQVVMQ